MLNHMIHSPARRLKQSPFLVPLAAIFLLLPLGAAQAQTAHAESRKEATHEARGIAKEERKERKAVRKLLKKGEIPVVVVSEFTKLYPDADGQWYLYQGDAEDAVGYTEGDQALANGVPAETDAYYEVVFLKDGKEHHSIFNRAGKLFESRRRVEETDLPDPVLKTLEDKYADWEVLKEKEEVKRHDLADVMYRVKVKQGHQKRVVYFDPMGDEVHPKKW